MNIPWKRWSIIFCTGLVTIGIVILIRSQLVDSHGTVSIIVSSLFIGAAVLVGVFQVILSQFPPHPGMAPSTLRPIIIGRIDATLAILLMLGIVISSVYPFSISPHPPVVGQAAPTVASTLTPSPVEFLKAMELYHSVIEGKMPDWSDNMDSASDSNSWSSFSGSSGGCGFVNGTYQVYAHKQNFVNMCFTSKLSGINFPYPSSNFAYQVLMTVKEGDGGGIIFRASSASYDAPMYRLDVRPQQQVFDILIQQNNSQRHNPACNSADGQYCYNAAIYATEKNELMVIAQDHDLYFFVNGVFLKQITDTTVSSGYIGVFAVDKDTPTNVIFDSAQLWNLP